jgi:DNA-directed RNA polymerase sigma subunit (sigma70/sigma32)
VRPRKPMRDLAQALAHVSDVADAARETEAKLASKRHELTEALRVARDLGATLEQLGDAAGVSRQRAAQILDRE